LVSVTALLLFSFTPAQAKPLEEPKPKKVTKHVSRSRPTIDTSASKNYASVFMLENYNWDTSEFVCLENLWNRESGWNPNAHNPYSGAHGIPQSLPGSKMASAGADWRTNPETQIRWGLNYIANRYQTPCGAWSHFKAKNWY
jgi:hypothetical protein